MPAHYKAHLALIIINLIYGANYIIAKEITPEYILPFGFILIRVSNALWLFWLFHYWFSKMSGSSNVLLKRKIERKDFFRLLFCALFGVAINQLLFFKGLSMTSPINASLIMITTPIVVLVIAFFILGEKITRFKLAGIILGGLGATLIILLGHQKPDSPASLMGDIFIFINAASYALYLILVKPLMQKYHPFTLIKWIFLFGLIYVFPFGWQEFKQIEWHTFTFSVWLGVLYVVLATTFIAYLFNIYALQKVDASVVSTYIYTQPVIATSIAVLLGKDQLSSIKLIAAAFIFVGVYLVSKKR